MNEAKKSGKTVLRSVDGRQAAGICSYTVGRDGIEANVSAQLFSGGQASAVLQFGPERDYLCRPAAGIAQPVRCGDAGIAAVWVLDDGVPALFGQLSAGAFNRDEARKRLPDGSPVKREDVRSDAAVKAVSVPVAAMSLPVVKPSNREPSSQDTAVPFQRRAQEARAESLYLLGSGSQPEKKGVEPEKGARGANAAPAEPLPQKPSQARPAAGQPWQPLVVKRAPRSTPRPPVYSPLWDDVSVEFEKMLDSLPQVHPFNGNAEGADAQFAEVPTDGAVQCYIGSVVINGLKVFLQAVPARPYARPAGFDHSLVSRSGECFWVKYFIQNT